MVSPADVDHSSAGSFAAPVAQIADADYASDYGAAIVGEAQVSGGIEDVLELLSVSNLAAAPDRGGPPPARTARAAGRCRCPPASLRRAGQHHLKVRRASRCAGCDVRGGSCVHSWR